MPQGSVLGPLLWNIMFEGPLKLKMPGGARLVTFADDVAVVIVAKTLEEIQSIPGVHISHKVAKAIKITNKKKYQAKKKILFLAQKNG